MPWFKSSLKSKLLVVVASLAVVLSGQEPARGQERETVWLAEVEQLIRNKGIFPLRNSLDRDFAGKSFYSYIDEALDDYDGRASRFIPHLKDFKTQFEPRSGLGLNLQIADNRCCRFTTVRDSAADKAGLPESGWLDRIEETETSSLSLTDIAVLLDEKREIQLDYSVGDTKKRVTLSPSKLENEQVSYQKLWSKDVLRIPVFHPETRFQVEKLIPSGDLIIDLRDNPGGSVRAAIRTACLFIEQDTLIYQERAKQGLSKRFCRWQSVFADKKVVILQNRDTASSAELFILAMKSRGDKTTTIGEKTFGKGVKSTLIPLSSGAGLLLSTKEYFGPQLEKVHNKGLKPDERHSQWSMLPAFLE